MEGVRLWAATDKPDIKFWRTEFSHFLSEDKIICTYQIFGRDSTDNLLSKVPLKELPNVKGSDAKAKFGFKDDEWQNLQQFILSEDFTEELNSIEAQCNENDVTKVMLHFEIPDINKPDQSIKVQYRQLKSGGADISGDSRFARIQSEDLT